METQPGSVPVSGTQRPRAPLQEEEPGLRSSLSSMGSEMWDMRTDEYTCYFCNKRATDSVVTPCGHIFCWPCLYWWLEDKAKPCPLCKVMVGTGNIVPVFGGRTRSCRESSIPPRPSAKQLHGSDDTAVEGYIVLSPAFRDEETPTVTVSSSWLRDTLRRSSLLEGLERDAHMETLRSRAQEMFRAIRVARPPSPIGWIAEASGSFDPSVRSRQDARLPLSDLHGFVTNYLLPQGAYFPGIEDYRVSWWPYFKALTPRGLEQELYAEFKESWCKHFHEAWDRAGRPAVDTSEHEFLCESEGSS